MIQETDQSGIVSKPEEDESESRERDREPEPPPPDQNQDSGGKTEESDSKVDQSNCFASPIISEELLKVPSPIIRASPESVVEFVESSSQDGSVLERLSPLTAPGRQSLLHDEQERNRHNESPVILAERINKPPPPALHHHHQLQQYNLQHRYSSSSPVIHRLESSSPQLHHRHPGLLDTAEKPPGHQTRHGDEAGHLMEVEAVGGGLPSGTGVVAGGVRGAAYGDSGSDSGISSLRSTGSGDERSGSRSSALSAEETTGSTTTTTTAQPAAAAARIWHVQSVQHTSLMMAHPQGGAAGQTMPATTPVGYTSPAASHHHHPEMLWRSPRYPPMSHAMLAPGQHTAEELLERDRHERMIR